MLNKKKVVFVHLLLCCFLCFSEAYHPKFEGTKDSKYKLNLYYNPITEYAERSINQIRKGAYKNSKSYDLTFKQVKRIIRNIKKEKLTIIYDLKINNDVDYVDFVLNKNAHSFGEITDSKGNKILNFTFDENYSEYMIINDVLVERSLSLYELIENDITAFVIKNAERKKIQEAKNLQDLDF